MSREYPCVYYDNQKCRKFEEPGYTSWCVMGPCSHETPSNADRIRAMSDEELAAWLVEKTMYQESAFSSPSYLNFLTKSDDTKEGALKGTMDWLRQPVKDGEDE